MVGVVVKMEREGKYDSFTESGVQGYRCVVDTMK